MKELQIVDLTETGIISLFKESLKEEFFKKLNGPVDCEWVAEEHCSKLIKNISDAGLDKQDITIAVRTPVIEAANFRPYKHRDLRAVKVIAGNWYEFIRIIKGVDK